MKIVYLHQYFNTPAMSGGTRSYEMARRLVDAGHEVHIVTSWRDETERKDWYITNESGVNVHWLPLPYSNHLSYFARIKVFFKFALAASRKAANLDADIVFATSTPLTIAIPGAFAAKKSKVPLVFEVRDLWPEMPIAIGAIRNPFIKFAARRLELWAYARSSAVVALSPGMKDGIIRSGYAANKIGVIPNGCDIDVFTTTEKRGERLALKHSWPDGQLVLLYAGTFGKINSVSYMVHLAEEMLRINSNVIFVMVGDGAEKAKVTALARSRGVLGVNMFIEDKIPKKDMPHLLAHATMASNLVIDIPEAQANSANKFFDSLAAGKPIFINHGGWMHDLIKKHECGLSSWQRPIGEIASDLHAKLNDSQWLAHAAFQSRQLANNLFDREQLATKLRSVLESVASGRAEEVSDIAPDRF